MPDVNEDSTWLSCSSPTGEGRVHDEGLTTTNACDEQRLIPWWAQALVAEWVGCPDMCDVLVVVARSWRKTCSTVRVTHRVYKCRHSGRRLSFPLPGTDQPLDGVAPAEFAAAWRRKSRELDELDSQLLLTSVQPVLCPHFGCCHEEATAAAASFHAVSCPVARRRGFSGFSYVPAAVVQAALEMRSRREFADVILDANLGGRVADPPRSCVCEVRTDCTPPALLLRQDGVVQSFQLGSEICIHRGWLLDDVRRTSMERGAFPRGVDRCPFLVSHRVSDECYRYSRSCGVHVLSGWVLCDERTQGGICVAADGCQPRQLLTSDEAWSRSLVVTLPAKPGAPKLRRADEVRHRFANGSFDNYYLYIPKIVDASCSALDDSWRTVLAQHLEKNGHTVSSHVCAEVKSLLDAPCPHPLMAEDLDAEYALCGINIIFLTFSTVDAAERFASWLESVAHGAVKQAPSSCKETEEVHLSNAGLEDQDHGTRGNVMLQSEAVLEELHCTSAVLSEPQCTLPMRTGVQSLKHIPVRTSAMHFLEVHISERIKCIDDACIAEFAAWNSEVNWTPGGCWEKEDDWVLSI